MLKVNINKREKNLDIWFDMPIPRSIEERGDMRIVINRLKESSGADLKRNADNSITGIVVDIERWMDFVKKNMPGEQSAFHRKIIDTILGRESGELGEGLKVNFHQHPFDTPERYWNFILDQGNFIDYFLNRLNWYLCPKHAIVTPFPIHVDLEASSACNMKCPMCYRDMLKETGHMEMDVFKKAVDECAAHNVFSIRLSWRGETLTHPRIKEMIAYSTKKIRNVSFLTNAFYLTEDMIDCFIDNGLSYVAVSFDGIGGTYEKIRHPAKFEENFKKLSLLLKKRGQKGRTLPQIRLCTIWPAIREDPDLYQETMKEVSDYMVCNPYINFKGPMSIKHDFICQYPWERIIVAFNGTAQCCTGWNADDIILGNISKTSIYQMWHSDRMNEVRRLHADGKRMALNSCANCRHGAKGDPDIKIDEIINRKI